MLYKLLALSALAAAAFAQAPANSPGVVTPGANAGLCLTANSGVNGAGVTIQTCIDAPSQVWNFTLVDNGSSVTVSTFNNTFCLDVTNGVNADGTLVQVWECVPGNTNQEWYYTGDNRCLVFVALSLVCE